MTIRERQKQLTREVISDTARHLFMERGFDAVSVAQIAAAAGVSEKTVYNHFPTKEDLFYSRMESFEQELLEAIRQRPVDQDVLEAFFGFVTQARGMLAAVEPDAGEQLYALQRVIADSPALLVREQQIYEGYTRALAQLIAEETNAAQSDVAPWVAANALIGVHRALVDWVRAAVLGGERDPKRLLRGMRSQAGRARATLERGLV